MRVIVVGAGAVGSLFGARLSGAGHDVLLVARPAHAAAIRAHGLRLESQPPATYRVAVVERLPNHTEADAILLAVKSYSIATAAREIAEAIRPPVPVLALQNGLGIEAHVAASLSAGGWHDAGRYVVRGINSVPAMLIEPGVVRPTGEGAILLGTSEGGARPRTVAMFSSLLASAGLATRPAEDLAKEEWRKVLINAAINPVTADHGIPNGQLARDPWRRQVLDLLGEAIEVSRAEGVELSPAEVERDLWKVVRQTAENRSSMLQDLDRGRRTEIDAISGAVLALGERHGLSLPATRRIVDRIRRRSDRSLPSPPFRSPLGSPKR
ncbi:MAG: 2-dehydropantoate 2-reductase [Thermoplasmata archaeon]|nr:2-dehydropantoate 2-reductase [Thermoplasmata archaeon]